MLKIQKLTFSNVFLKVQFLTFDTGKFQHIFLYMVSLLHMQSAKYTRQSVHTRARMKSILFSLRQTVQFSRSSQSALVQSIFIKNKYCVFVATFTVRYLLVIMEAALRHKDASYLAIPPNSIVKYRTCLIFSNRHIKHSCLLLTKMFVQSYRFTSYLYLRCLITTHSVYVY